MLFNCSEKKRDIINLFKEALHYSCEDRILLPFHMEQKTVSNLIKHFEPEFYNDLNLSEKTYFKEILKLYKIEDKPLLSGREMDASEQQGIRH